jgi:hypothetical protein
MVTDEAIPTLGGKVKRIVSSRPAWEIIHRKFQASLGYIIRSYHKTNKQKMLFRAEIFQTNFQFV